MKQAITRKILKKIVVIVDGSEMVYQDRIVLCASSSYEKKYYFNSDFSSLPKQIQDELKISCVLYTEEVGGILTLEFEENGELKLVVTADEGDLLFDEIGSELKIKQMREQKRDLWESLELYYKTFFLGEEIEK